MSFLTKILNYIFGEQPKSGFVIQSVRYSTRQKDITPENSKWRDVELSERSVEIVLVSVGEPILSGLDDAIKNGSIVKVETVWIGNKKQTLHPDTKEKTIE